MTMARLWRDHGSHGSPRPLAWPTAAITLGVPAIASYPSEALLDELQA